MHSMTAFSRIQTSFEPYELTWEIKTVNHRFLDVLFRLPESMRFLEPHLRQLISQKLSRGRVEVSLQLKAFQSQSLPRLNQHLLNELINLSTEIADKYQIPNDFGVHSCLTWPNIWENNDTGSQEVLKEKCLESFDAAIDELLMFRNQEGQAIAFMLKERVEGIQKHLKLIKSELINEPQRLRDKIKTKMELLVPGVVDEQRFEQELALLLMRLDIAEEIDRLETHLIEMNKAIENKGAIGRRLDFLIQELHRETNTISSKTDSKSISYHSIEIKVLIEQMREQIQNVE
jgi:uncharacterized protein (TIGR00255 family)